MEFRNAIFNAAGNIDCEINHPQLGWIPFTADPADVDPIGLEVFAAALEMGPSPYVPPPPLPATGADVDAERDRRLALPFAFNGDMFDRDPVSLQRITGAAALAGFAVLAGAQAGDLFWHGEQTPYVWITATSTLVTMDAPTCFAFGKAAAAVEGRLVFAARALKQMDPIPADFADDGYWP